MGPVHLGEETSGVCRFYGMITMMPCPCARGGEHEARRGPVQVEPPITPPRRAPTRGARSSTHDGCNRWGWRPLAATTAARWPRLGGQLPPLPTRQLARCAGSPAA